MMRGRSDSAHTKDQLDDDVNSEKKKKKKKSYSAPYIFSVGGSQLFLIEAFDDDPVALTMLPTMLFV